MSDYSIWDLGYSRELDKTNPADFGTSDGTSGNPSSIIDFQPNLTDFSGGNSGGSSGADSFNGGITTDNETPSALQTNILISDFITFSHGIGTKDLDPTLTTTQTITHGLGKTPSIIKLVTMHAGGGVLTESNGIYKTSDSTYSMVFLGGSTIAGMTVGSFSTMIGRIKKAADIASITVANVNSNAFDLVWSYEGGVGSGTVYYKWEVQ